jgi:hypothetical protein
MGLLLLTGIAALTPSSTIKAQACTGVLGKVTYDTTVTESYSGTSSASGGFTYTVPKFNLALATLYAAEISSTIITATVDPNIYNYSGSTGAPSLQLYRTDGVTATGLPNGSNGYVTTGTPYTGPNIPSPGNEIVPMNNVITNMRLLNDSIADATLSALEGTGNITFNYSNTSQALGNSGFFPLATTASDKVTFGVTYYYCQYILAINLVSFTAVRESPQTIHLAWTSANEEANRTYNVQVSADGTNFSDVGSVQSDPVNTDASYGYNYPVSPTATGRLFFRLRMIDNNGAVTFSAICLVNLNGTATTAFSIYPNPATDFINLVLPGGNQSWNVDIIAADGNLVQRNVFTNTALGRVDFSRKLARGTYFVRATNTTSGEQHGGSFVIPQ